MNIEEYKEAAKIVRRTDVYDVYDLSSLERLNLSLTELNGFQKTGGHYHDAEEVYIFIEGNGKIQIGENFTECKAGDVFLIPSDNFHRVWNEGSDVLKFWSIFEKYGDRR